MAGYGSQVTMTMALRRVKAAPATAMSYLSVVWGILAGLAIFSVSCCVGQPEAVSENSYTSRSQELSAGVTGSATAACLALRVGS